MHPGVRCACTLLLLPCLAVPLEALVSDAFVLDAPALHAQSSQSAAAKAAAPSAGRQSFPDSIRDFGAVVSQLSEPGGYFNTDNLISNEASYLHVMGALDRLRIRDGVYIGVGPDQNFSYIARIRPRAAFLIDIRRDNMLQHLMFKALFDASRNRAEYLALLLGRPAPSARLTQPTTSLDAIIAWLDTTAATAASRQAATASVRRNVRRYGVTLGEEDLATIERFHRAFIDDGLGLQFTTKGRAPQYYYPTLRQLLVERDASGKLAGYLVREADFQYLRSMQRRNLIVPVVGDLAGPRALRGIGNYARQRGEVISAIYVSNAEDYLLRGGSCANYPSSVGTLPRKPNSVMIRSFFGGPGSHPASIDDYYSTQLLQRVDDFLVQAPAARFYRDVVMYKFLPLR